MARNGKMSFQKNYKGDSNQRENHIIYRIGIENEKRDHGRARILIHSEIDKSANKDKGKTIYTKPSGTMQGTLARDTSPRKEASMNQRLLNKRTLDTTRMKSIQTTWQ